MLLAAGSEPFGLPLAGLGYDVTAATDRIEDARYDALVTVGPGADPLSTEDVRALRVGGVIVDAGGISNRPAFPRLRARLERA